MAFSLCPQDIGIILTYRCHGRCQHCLYNCGPHWPQETMSPATVRDVLKAVAIWPHCPQVHFTGGEPFLDFPLLLHAVELAAEFGIPRYVETSGSWCTGDELALSQFTELREAGLQAVLISCSPFHAERIPPVRTLRAVRTAIQVFGRERVMVYLPAFLGVIQRFEQERPTPLSVYEEELGPVEAQRVLWWGYGLIGGGRAGYCLGRLVARRPAEAFVHDTCANEILHAVHSHMDLYGHFISGFCGGLTVGEWRALPQLLADFQAGRYPDLVRVLIDEGPYGLYQLAWNEYAFRPRPEGYADKCHLCVDVRCHLAAAGEFLELRPLEFYKRC
ncbi:MAG: radical SAM protein [Chloroflexi bacterium]|nr:radical SAM protein [Chloroflexota bacterium]